jgi:hypothetical protein
MVGDPEQAGIFARIGFVEDISDVDVDLADDRAGGLHLLVGGHVGGARFLDSGVLAVGQLRGKSGTGDGGRQDRQSEQTASRQKLARELRYRSRRCESAEREECP